MFVADDLKMKQTAQPELQVRQNNNNSNIIIIINRKRKRDHQSIDSGDHTDSWSSSRAFFGFV